MPPPVRVQSLQAALWGPPCVETGAAKEESPGWRPGGFFAVAGVLVRFGHTKVVASRPCIREECGEGAAAHHVGARLGALAVAYRDHAVEVDGHLHTATVVLTPAGLPPDRVRQVGH